MNAAKYARKLKHIRKVKGALRYREQTKKRLDPIKKENKETKRYITESLYHTNRDFRADLKTARQNAKEDWILGPLRPNRAAGEDSERYGTLERFQIGRPSLPKHWYGAKEGVQRRMKTRIPENVFRDQWPIVEDDRVVVIRGSEKNRIGYVKEVLKDTHTVSPLWHIAI
jgi:large subunit ribosomal protein L24